MTKFKNISEIKGFEKFNNYLIGNDGTLINIKLNKSVPGSKSDKYKYFTISNKDNRLTISAHKLVALAFVGGYFKDAEVDHIDRDTYNNHYTNLRWVSLKENRQNRIVPAKFSKKFVIAECLHTKKTQLFNSITEASKELNINYCTLYAVYNKNRKKCQGYNFYFASK